MPKHGIQVAVKGESATLKPDNPYNIQKFSLASPLETFTLLKVKEAKKKTLAQGEEILIPHNLPYIPIVWVFLKDGESLYPVYDHITGTYMYVDDTNLVIKNNESGSKDFYYYIFFDVI